MLPPVLIIGMNGTPLVLSVACTNTGHVAAGFGRDSFPIATRSYCSQSSSTPHTSSESLQLFPFSQSRPYGTCRAIVTIAESSRRATAPRSKARMCSLTSNVR